MIVDDEPLALTVLSKYFDKMCITPEATARDGEEAVNKYINLHKAKKQVRIITMDINMPKLDGKAAAKKIRAYEKENKIKPATLIMISANCNSSEIEECLNPNGDIRATSFLKKPVTHDGLKNVLKNQLKYDV